MSTDVLEIATHSQLPKKAVDNPTARVRMQERIARKTIETSLADRVCPSTINQPGYTNPDWLLRGNSPSQYLWPESLDILLEQKNLRRIIEHPLHTLYTLLENNLTNLNIALSPKDRDIIEKGVVRVLVLQSHLGTTFPRPYHSPDHTLQVVFNILSLVSSSQIIEALVHKELLDLIITALYHDSIMYVSYASKNGLSIHKLEQNEHESVCGLDDTLEILNSVTQVICLNNARPIYPSNLYSVLASSRYSLEFKIAATMLSFVDTYSSNPEEYLSNAIKVWMEEHALIKTFAVLEACNDDSVKMRLIQTLKTKNDLRSFVETIFSELKGVGSVKISQLRKELFLSLHSFLKFQPTIAQNFKSNLEDALGIIISNHPEAENIIMELRLRTNFEGHYDEITRLITDASKHSFIGGGVDDLDALIALLEDPRRFLGIP